jgi:hypothetical protein
MTMKRYIQVVLVNHIPQMNNDLEKRILELGLTKDVKTAVNGGHAFLHINHLHLSGKIHEGNIFLLLNPETPMVTGLEFLTEYKDARDLKKEKINIAILDNGLTIEFKRKIKQFGIESFVNIKNLEADIRKIVNLNKDQGESSPLAA